MFRRSRFSLPAPSAGDALLKRATSCKLEFTRWPADEQLGELLHGDEVSPGNAGDDAAQDGPVEVELAFELKGSLPVAGREGAALLLAIAREFVQPLRGGKRGGA